MSSSTSLLLLAALLTACGTSEGRSAPAAAAAPAAGPTYVLVDRDAWFYQAPRSDAPRQSESTTPRTGDAINDRALPLRFEWVADHGGSKGDSAWVEVRPTAQEPKHCVDPPGALKHFDLRLFVKKSALVPVVTASVSHTQNDGNQATALAGRWLRRGQAEVVETRDGHAKVQIPLPAASVGDRYTDGIMRVKLADWTYYVEQDSVFATDWEPPEGGKVSQVLAVAPDANKPGHTIATLRSRCVETTRSVKRVGQPGVAPLKQLGGQLGGTVSLGTVDSDTLFGRGADEPFAVGGGIAIGRTGGLGGAPKPVAKPPEIAKGTTIYWPEGQPAGTVVSATTPRAEVPSVRPDRRCFSWTMRFSINEPDTETHGWTFCVDGSAVPTSR